MVLILKRRGYLHNERIAILLQSFIFIIHQDLSFGGFALKIEFVVFVYESIDHLLLFYEIIFLVM